MSVKIAVVIALTLAGMGEEIQERERLLAKYESIPLFLSWYDPELCKEENGGISTNCNDDPEHMAGGHKVEEWYGRAAACPPELWGMTIVIQDLGSRVCLDRGSRIKPTYREVYTPEGFVTGWFMVVDLLERHEEPPWWEFSMWEEWHIVDG